MKCICAASGEPPLLLAASVHCATRAAIKEAQKQIRKWRHQEQDESGYALQLQVPATMAVVKELYGLDYVETYLKWRTTMNWPKTQLFKCLIMNITIYTWNLLLKIFITFFFLVSCVRSVNKIFVFSLKNLSSLTISAYLSLTNIISLFIKISSSIVFFSLSNKYNYNFSPTKIFIF